MKPKPYHQRNGVILYHADCREILGQLDDASIDMILTDPPYGQSYRSPSTDTAIANDEPDDFSMVAWSFDEAARLLKPGAPALYFCSGSVPTIQARWSLAMDEVLDHDTRIVWSKPGIGMGARYRNCYENILVGYRPGKTKQWYGNKAVRNLLEFSRVLPEPDGHPTPKPVALLSYLIRLHTAYPEDLILDPFAGSGTALAAALLEDRRAIGIELEEKWCEQAAMRMDEAALGVEMMVPMQYSAIPSWIDA